MALVVTGRLNKQIACDLGISEATVKARRGQVMRKMNAASLPQLARMADSLNLTAESPGAVKPVHEFDLPLGVYPAADFLPRYQSILSQLLQKTVPRHGEGKQTVRTRDNGRWTGQSGPCGTRSISSAILLVSVMLCPAAIVPAQPT